MSVSLQIENINTSESKLLGSPVSFVSPTFKHRCGQLTLIFGPMFAGKTQELYRRMSQYLAAKRKCLYINSLSDTRSTNNFSTHSPIINSFPEQKESFESIKVHNIKSILEKCRNFDVIAIDEQHMYTDLISSVKNLVDIGKIVLVAGLSGDAEMRPIGGILELIPFADEVEFLTAKCHLCANPQPPYNSVDASFSVRNRKVAVEKTKMENGQEIEAGGSDKYFAACRSCYLASR